MMVWPMAPCSVKRLHHLRDRRALLADGAVDADQIVLGVVDDGVEQDGGLARLPVADDQLALPAANGNHGVDGLQTRSHRLAHGLAVDDAGSQTLDGQGFSGGNGALVVDGLAQRVNHAADQGRSHGHGKNLAGAFDFVAFFQLGVVAQDDRAYLVFFERERKARNAVREAEQLAGHHLVQAVEARNAVAQRGDGPHFVHLDLRVVVRDLLAKNLCNLVCFDLSHFVDPASVSC